MLTALTVYQFRPIALENFLFKIITKIIADRLVVVCSLSNQSDFIRSRQIVDYITGASECLNVLSIDSHGGLLALNRKVFDSISWFFLFEILRSFAFSESFIVGFVLFLIMLGFRC